MSSGVLYLKVVDPYKASYGVEDAEFAITQLAQTTMRYVISEGKKNTTARMLFTRELQLRSGATSPQLQIRNRQDLFGHGVSGARKSQHKHRPTNQHRSGSLGDRLQEIRNQGHLSAEQGQRGHAGERWRKRL